MTRFDQVYDNNRQYKNKYISALCIDPEEEPLKSAVLDDFNDLHSFISSPFILGCVLIQVHCQCQYCNFAVLAFGINPLSCATDTGPCITAWTGKNLNLYRQSPVLIVH